MWAVVRRRVNLTLPPPPLVPLILYDDMLNALTMRYWRLRQLPGIHKLMLTALICHVPLSASQGAVNNNNIIFIGCLRNVTNNFMTLLCNGGLSMTITTTQQTAALRYKWVHPNTIVITSNSFTLQLKEIQWFYLDSSKIETVDGNGSSYYALIRLM